MTPCQADPVSFDADPDNGIPHPPINQMIHACLTRCPMFAWCQAQDNSETYGVVAGSYRPHPDPLLSGLKPNPLQAARFLIEAIAQLDPFELVPSQREVCEATGVARSAVRVAIQVLAAAGVIEPAQIQGLGMRYVATPTNTAPVLAEAAA